MNCEHVDLSGQEMDKSGYYTLIKVDKVTRRIGVQVCNANHMDCETFWGYQCQDVYVSVLRDARAVDWFTDPTHIAYLGKELKKAEIALATGSSYYQE